MMMCYIIDMDRGEHSRYNKHAYYIGYATSFSGG